MPVVYLLPLRDDAMSWNNASWLYPRAVRILNIKAYRSSVLDGLILSLASRTDSTQRPASSGLVNYVRELPLLPKTEDDYSLITIIQDLLRKTDGNTAKNSIMVPILQVVQVLLEGMVLQPLGDHELGVDRLVIPICLQ
jgi:hypothetical protein